MWRRSHVEREKWIRRMRYNHTTISSRKRDVEAAWQAHEVVTQQAEEMVDNQI
jgi:hypothetical protein